MQRRSVWRGAHLPRRSSSIVLTMLPRIIPKEGSHWNACVSNCDTPRPSARKLPGHGRPKGSGRLGDSCTKSAANPRSRREPTE